MTSGQKYEGKANNANPVEQTGSNNDLTVENTPAAVNNGIVPPAGSDLVDFDSLQKEYNLSDLDILMLEALYEDGQTSVVVKAAATRLSVANSLNSSGIPISIPDYLQQTLSSHEGAESLREYLRTIFVEYVCSKTFRKDITLANIRKSQDVHGSLINIIDQVSEHLAGVAPDRTVATPLDIESNPVQPEAYPVLMNNPLNTSDVAKLQKWVRALQELALSQVKLTEGLEKHIEKQERLDDNLTAAHNSDRVVISSQRYLIDELTAQIDELKAPKAKPPVGDSFITLKLSVDEDYHDSEALIVQLALATYRDEQLKQMLLETRNSELENAHLAFKNYESAQDLLNKLSQKAVELADNNYWAGRLNGDVQKYEGEKKSRRDYDNFSYEAFSQKYLGIEMTEEELDELDAELDAKQAEEPEYLKGLTDVEKDIMGDLKSNLISKVDDSLVNMRKTLFGKSENEATPEAPTSAE